MEESKIREILLASQKLHGIRPQFVLLEGMQLHMGEDELTRK